MSNHTPLQTKDIYLYLNLFPDSWDITICFIKDIGIWPYSNLFSPTITLLWLKFSFIRIVNRNSYLIGIICSIFSIIQIIQIDKTCRIITWRSKISFLTIIITKSTSKLFLLNVHLTYMGTNAMFKRWRVITLITNK